MRLSRRVQIAAGLVAFVLVRHTPPAVAEFIARVWLLRTEIAFLAAAFPSGRAFPVFGTVDIVTLGVIFLAVCGPLVSVMYPVSLRDPLATQNRFRAFRLLVATHVVCVYATAVGMRRLLTDAIPWLLDGPAPLGISPMGWTQAWVFGYGLVLLPLSVGGLLSRLEAGVAALPTPDGPAMELVRNLQPGKPTPADFDAPGLAWWFVGLLHALPAVALGLLFVVIDALPPLLDGMLVVGIVIALFGSGDPVQSLAAFDLEHRLGRTLRFTTVNLRSVLSATSILIGAALGGVLAIWIGQPGFRLWATPNPGVGLVTRAGILVGLVVYAVGMTGTWLRLADRLPWFITAWTAASDQYDARAFDTPAGDCPPRFPVGPLVSGLFLIGASRAVMAPGSALAALYAVGWPVGVAFIGWRVTRPRASVSAARDNRAIALALAVQVVLLFYQASRPVALSIGSLRGGQPVPTTVFETSAGSDLLLLAGVAVFVVLVYFIPELMEFATTWSSGQDSPNLGSLMAGDELRVYRLSITLTFGIMVWGVAVLVARFGITAGPLMIYLCCGVGAITAILWWLDPPQFEQLDSLPPRTEAVAELGVWVYFLGVAVLSRRLPLVPNRISVAGVAVTAVGMGYVLARYWYRSRRLP
jgi:hypothetical protein